MTLRSTNWLDAVDPKHSVWVAANAGSGKTHTLANRVTRLLLEGVKPEKILCLTFTKAAAAEMQHRLFKQLGEWSMLDDEKLRAQIVDIGGEAPDKRELAKARRLFALALETPGGLKIQTLHGFCERLLTRFPLEAGVPASFQVLDDPTSHELIAEARADVLERAGQGDEHLAQAAALLATHSGEPTVAEMLKVAMGSERGKLDAFVADKEPEEIVEAIATAHGISPGDTYESIAGDFCAQMRREEVQLKNLAGWLATGTKSDVETSGRLKALIAGRFGSDQLSTFFLALLTKEGEARARIATKKLETSHPALFQELAALQRRMREAQQRCMAANAAALAQAAITLACAARAVYTRAKQVRGVLDYSDLIASSVALLERSDAAAWVLYKLDQGIDHILIDEAQDTSPEQWRIVKRLSSEFFVGEGARDGITRTIFAVGDEKQSIFSFQGAAPREFGLSKQEFQALVERAGDTLREVDLVESRRSTREVLDFVDKVFAGSARDGLTSDDQVIEHTPYRKEAKGRVEFWPVIAPGDEQDTNYWMLPLDVERPHSPVRQLANEIALRIRSWCDGKTKLSGLADVKPEDDRPIRPGDIMILTPRREPFASEIIRRLKELNVPVAGADRIRLIQQIGVMDLIALGRFALLPEDDLNLASLLRSPLIGFSEDDLYALAQPRKAGLWRELIARAKENGVFTAAHEHLAQVLKRADYAPPHEFYAHALGPEHGREKLLKRLGPEAQDAIDEVLSLALAYEQLNVPSLEGFLHWIERGEAEIKRDMERGRDEVRVITVHGAKGLEAPIVILPDTARAPQTAHSRLILEGNAAFFSVSDKEAPEVIADAKQARKEASLQEHRRLLYVALTRPRDRLYIHGFRGKKPLNQESWYQQIMNADPALIPEADKPRVIGDVDTEPFIPRDAGAAIEHPPLPAWANADAAKERVKPRLIRASDAAGLEQPATLSPLDGDGAKRFQRGNLIHGLLAHLPDIAPDQRRDAALRYLRGNKVDDAEAAKLANETLAVLTDKQFAAAFAEGSKAEVALIADLSAELGDGARLNGRIDRLAITADEVLVVDFKTNRPPPPDAEHVATVYKAQMALYKAALSKVFPGKRITCALVWTDGPRLMPLPDAMLEAELGHIRARLDSAPSTTKY